MRLHIILFLFAGMGLLGSCKSKTAVMHDNNDIADNMDALKKSMLTYIQEGQSGYDANDIQECERLLNLYLNKASLAEDKMTFLSHAQETIGKLNALNKKCNYEMIETSEREYICAIMIRAGQLRGFNTMDDDFTEEWREW